MMLLPQFERIAQELRNKVQWVNWRLEKREGKPKKVPINSRTGRLASSTNPRTWSTFEDAIQRDSEHIGFVFNNDYIGVDLDHALFRETRTGLGNWDTHSWAQQIQKRLSGTYCEVSPSGTGLHFISRGRLPEGCKGLNKRRYGGNDGAIEVYSSGRFFTVTGQSVFPDSTIKITDRSEQFIELYRELSTLNGSRPNPSQRETKSQTTTDTAERLEIALKDPVFSRLWIGDTSGHPSTSEADLALANKLCFYFGSDPDLVDRMFRQSKLYRPKWERAGYRESTISKAISGTSEHYTPKQKAAKTRGTTHQADSRNEAYEQPREEHSAEPEPDFDTAPPLPNLNTAVKTIERDPNFCRVWFDEFLQRILTDDPAREWNEADDIHLTLRFQREKKIPKMSVETVRNAVTEIAFRRKKNCIKDWLDSLRWDQEPRIDHFFEDYYGAIANTYTQAAGRNFLISMVARVYRPGCQVDTMPVLEGPQGIFKSSSLRALAGEHHSEQHETVTSKDFFQNLQGKWLIEISEMSAFSKSEISRVKQVISAPSDHFRPSYGRRSVDHPRQCIFCGTTNSDDWHHDVTGGRRFWPITCRDIDIDGLRANREQLFAEAVARFKAGESWWDMPIEKTLQEQGRRYTEPAWVEPIQRYIENEPREDGEYWIPRSEPLTDVSIAELLEEALNIPKAQWTKATEMRVAESLRFLGWTRGTTRHEGKPAKRWALLPVTT